MNKTFTDATGARKIIKIAAGAAFAISATVQSAFAAYSLIDYSTHLSPGQACYSGTSDIVATVLETNCYEAYQNMVGFEENLGVEYCPSTISSVASAPETCFFNNFSSDLLGYKDLIICVRKDASFENDWQAFYTQKPSYLGDDGYISCYRNPQQGTYCEETNTAQCTDLMSVCEDNEYWDGNEYECKNCPNNGQSDAGIETPITNCYLPDGTSANDTSGTFKISGGKCYYK